MENQEETERTKSDIIKHDIRNQLSNITLALEQLSHEVENPTADATICFEILASSCVRINSLINDL